MNIKHCPFCGGVADLIMSEQAYDHKYGALKHGYRVRCQDCSIGTETHYSNVRLNVKGEIDVYANGAKEAITLWNQRVEERSEKE